MKVSLLILTANATQRVKKLVSSLIGYDYIQEVIIVDSSKPLLHKRLKAFTGSIKKIKLYHTIPLGYADPLRAYALNKVSTKYVLYLDDDEVPSKHLLSLLETLENNFDAYVIPRYEIEHNFFTYQVRIFNKDKVLFKGIIHEVPTVYSSKVHYLRNPYIIYHVTKEHNKELKYSILELYMKRYSYIKTIRATGGIARYYSLLNEGIRSLAQKSLYTIKFNIKYRKLRAKLLNIIDRKLLKLLNNIQIEVNRSKRGIIGYLCLDNENYVDSLTRTFEWDCPGLVLLQQLIFYRYLNNKCAHKYTELREIKECILFSKYGVPLKINSECLNLLRR